ncbi:hypothetical protein GCM10009534_50380 [Kribbella sandramycini]
MRPDVPSNVVDVLAVPCAFRTRIIFLVPTIEYVTFTFAFPPGQFRYENPIPRPTESVALDDRTQVTAAASPTTGPATNPAVNNPSTNTPRTTTLTTHSYLDRTPPT